MSKFEKPCLIISSPRSGSKLLRDLLMESGEFNCYPYDINYVWMHGFMDKSDDELSASEFNQSNAEYIRGYLLRLLRDNPEARILEKTVSNGLRLDYVLKIIPEARIIHLIRDGREVTASIKSCWFEPVYSEKNQDWKLLFQKLSNFPLRSAGSYLSSYIRNNLPKLFGDRCVKSWGPRFKGMDQMLQDESLVEVCATQWARSVSQTNAVLEDLVDSSSYIEIRYEDLLENPSQKIAEISAFLELNAECTNRMTLWAFGNFRKISGNWESIFDLNERSLAMPILEKELSRFGYVCYKY